MGSLTRIEMVPDLPTLDESGLKGYECANWYAIATASATPKPIVKKLHDEIARYLWLPKTRMAGLKDPQRHAAIRS